MCKKLTAPRQAFIIQMIATYKETQYAQLCRMLANDEVGEEFGFKPLERISIEGVRKFILKDETQKIITQIRRDYLTDWNDTPFAHKKIRVQELATMYDKLTVEPGLYGKGVVDMRVQLLKAIRDEIGEHIDKLAAAVGKQGSEFHLTLNINSMDDPNRARLDRTAGFVLRDTGNGHGTEARFVVMDN